MGRLVSLLLGITVLGGCARLVDDPLATANVYGGLSDYVAPAGPLVAVLDRADDTPAKQGLLYTAMVEADVAYQFAGQALAYRDESGRMRSAIGEVLHAVDPAAAPAWDAKYDGIVAGWAGRGYGVRRAAVAIAEDIRAAVADEDAPAPLAELGPRASSCAEMTAQRAEQIVQLGRPLLTSPPVKARSTLEQIQELARALNQGDSGCGLQQVKQFLDQIRPPERG